MNGPSVVQISARPAQRAGGETVALTIAGTPCLLRDHPREASRRVTLVLRRGIPEQNRPWLATAGTAGPVAIVGIESWANFEVSYESVADGFLDALALRGREVELCLSGAGLGSFSAIVLGAQLAERLAPTPVKVTAFSLVAQLYRMHHGTEIFHAAVGPGLRTRPETLAGLRRYAELRSILEQAAMAGANLKVCVFATPLALVEWQQFLTIHEAPNVSHVEVLADDVNQDMMSWLMLLPNDAPASRERLMRWTQGRNPSWAPRVVEAKVDRELPVALAWRRSYPSLAATFDRM